MDKIAFYRKIVCPLHIKGMFSRLNINFLTLNASFDFRIAVLRPNLSKQTNLIPRNVYTPFFRSNFQIRGTGTCLT